MTQAIDFHNILLCHRQKTKKWKCRKTATFSESEQRGKEGCLFVEVDYRVAVSSGLVILGWRSVKEENAKEAFLLNSWKCWVVISSARGKEFMLPSPGLGSSSPKAMQANKLRFHQVDERSQSGTNLT